MGSRGPAPLPDNVLEMRGTFRGDRRPGQQVDAERLVRPPTAPKHLGELAKKIWRQKAKLLIQLELLTIGDLASLEGYCVAHERAIDAEAIVAVEGRTVRSIEGGLKRHPELVTAEKARADMRRYEQEFGLTPSARARMRIPIKGDAKVAENPFGAAAKKAARKGA